MTYNYEEYVSTIEEQQTRAAAIRVKRGARFLDEVAPGWDTRIDLDTLRLSDGSACICGQVFKDKVSDPDMDNGFGWAVDHLFAQANAWVTGVVRQAAFTQEQIDAQDSLTFDDYDHYDDIKWAGDRACKVSTALGFEDGRFDGRAQTDDTYVEYWPLTEAWRSFILNRRATA